MSPLTDKMARALVESCELSVSYSVSAQLNVNTNW